MIRFLAFAAFVLLAFFALSPSNVFGDLIELTDGRIIEGKAVEKGDDLRIEFEHGAITVPRTMVVRVEKKKLPREEYAERRTTLDPRDVAGWQGFALFCREKKLQRELREVLQHLVQVDPDNVVARTELGYVKVGDKWLTVEEHFTSLGYVQYEGKWITREERDLLEAVKTKKAIELRTIARARELLKRMETADPDALMECRERLAAIEPELKLAPLIDALFTKNRELREYVLGELSTTADVRCVPALVEIYLLDDEDMSRAALEGIQRIKNADPVPTLIRGVADRDGFVRYRAALLLAQVGDKRAVEPLLAALEATLRPGATMIESESQPAEVIRAAEVVRKTGPITDEDRKVGEKIEVDIPRPATPTRPVVPVNQERTAIRAALRKLTGFDFGYNFPLWRYALDKIKNPEQH